ncbi:hypothetical protein D3C78_1217120 [compost metagenome]
MTVHLEGPGAVVRLWRVAKAGMAAEFGGLLWASLSGQVARSGDDQQAAAAELADDFPRIELAGDTNRQVDAFFDQVLLPVAEVHRQADLGVGLRELQKQRHQPAQAEAERQADAQLPAGGQPLLHHPGFGLFDQFENHPALFQVGTACRGQRQAPRAAHHELDAQVLFQCRDLPGNHRACHAELAGGGREAAQFGHPHEQVHRIESVHC